LDNAVVASHPHTHETAVPEEHHHAVLPQHLHHFETEEQQREAGTFGMWLFLLTEIMFFGGLFFAYLLYRNWYYDAFVAASNQLSIPLGAVNTVFLITSGFFMALGVWAAEVRKRGLLLIFLILTTVFGLAFLGIKYVEYHEKWEKHHIPGANFDVSEFVNPKAHGIDNEKPLPLDMAQKTQVFFSLYFAMTGMHALHMIIGIVLLGWLTWRAYYGEFSSGYVAPIENFGLYWHFVDIVWLFLFPLLYLINRHPMK
jgi:cytochrome c oxidase subunit III